MKRALVSLTAIMLLATSPAFASTPKIGSSITLKGNDSSEQVKVKLVRVIDPITDAGTFSTPKAGYRFVGVVVKLTNIGKARYSDSPSNGASLIYGTHQASSTFVTEGICDISTFSSTRIVHGDSRQGCIPYQVPKGRKVTKFQFTLDSGFADQTGEWRLVK